MAPKSINKRLGLLTAWLFYAETNDLVSVNVAKGVTVSASKTPRERRLPFSMDDYRALFSSKVFAERHRPLGAGGEAAFWIPIEYRDSLPPSGICSPLVRASENRVQSAAFSQWFGRYLRKAVGIKDSRKVLHSTRHTFKDICRDAGVITEVHGRLTGHAAGNVGEATASACRSEPSTRLS
jgi:hypothetical protein